VYLLPFSFECIAARQITRIELHGYSSADNDGLEDAIAEQGLVLSQKRIYAFNADGLITDVLDEQFLGDDVPAVSFHAAWTYNAQGAPERVLLEEKLGELKKPHTLNFDYLPDGRPSASVDPDWLSTYVGYDDAQRHTYMVRKYPKQGGTEVWVVGEEGAFPDSTCMEIYADVASGRSAFIDYAQAGQKLVNINFMERKARMVTREVHMTRKDRIDFKVGRSFNPDGNVAERKYRWEEEGARVSTLTRYRYTPTGDLEEIVVQHKPFNGDLRNQIDRYEYDAAGLLRKQVRTTRKNNDPQEVEWLGFYTVTQAEGSAASGNAQPSGNR
jgi:hypothetical protein